MKGILQFVLQALSAVGFEIYLSFPYEDKKRYLPILHISVGTHRNSSKS